LKNTLGELADAVEGSLPEGIRDDVFTRISTDTRSVRPGEVFFALKGDRFDGHRFLRDAWERKAVGLVCSEKSEDPAVQERQIRVQDTLKALGDWAGHYRRKFDIPIVAITGSSGKTMTKDLVASVLGVRMQAAATEKNQNNLIGVPLSLCGMDEEHEVGIFELGINEPHEMSRLAKMTSPTIAVITNIGPVHLAGLGDVSAVAARKRELLEQMEGGVAVLNGDDPQTPFLREGFSGDVVTFGRSKGASFRISSVRIDFESDPPSTEFDVEGEGSFRLAGTGEHCILNALPAIAISKSFGFSREEIQKGLDALHPAPMRMEWTMAGGLRILNDSYNANPDSMREALKVLSQAPAKQRAAALGDMLELGDDADAFHRQVGEAAARFGIDFLFLIGEHAGDYVAGAKEGGMAESQTMIASSLEEMATHLTSVLDEGDALLLKGSHRAGMERLLKFLRDE